MFLTLLLVTFLIATGVSLLVSRFFAEPIRRILGHIVVADVTYVWSRYISFAILVVGISSGVRIYSLEQYITPMGSPDRFDPLVLNTDRWVLEIYRTVIGSLSGIAWMLLVFFVVTLVAYVIIRVFESRRS